MIVRNEESNIANCIHNLKRVVDEVIVVDTGSEDGTIQIAKDLGAFVYEQKWENDFSKARNAALDQAKGDWIIFLDADEYFSEDSLPKVRSIIEQTHSKQSVNGILCGLVNIDTDNQKAIGSYDILRIFRNGKKYRFINRIHEEIRYGGKALQCENKRDELMIIHTGYSSSKSDKKIRRNLELLLNNRNDEKADYYLAITYHLLKDYDHALKHAESALSDPAVTQYDYLAYKLHMIRIMVAVDQEFHNKEKIRKLIGEANKNFGNHPEIAKIEAAYFMKEKQYEKALEKYLFALECHKNGKVWTQNDFEGSLPDVYFSVAEILCLMNRETDALDYYVRLLSVDKYNVPGFMNMLKLFREVPEDDVIAFLNSIYDIGREEDVSFIVSIISKTGRPKLILYYTIIWNKTFLHEDDVLIYAFLSQGNYRQSLEIAMLYAEAEPKAYAPLVTAIILMGGLYSEADIIKEKLGPDYFNLILCFAEGGHYSGEKDIYLSVLSLLVKFSGQHEFINFIKIVRDSDSSIRWEIAEFLIHEHQYEWAIRSYTDLYSLPCCEDRKTDALFKLGYCYYKLKQYRESLDWFERAIIGGYSENDLSEILRWVRTQSSDPGVNQKAEALSASCHNGSVENR